MLTALALLPEGEAGLALQRLHNRTNNKKRNYIMLMVSNEKATEQDVSHGIIVLLLLLLPLLLPGLPGLGLAG